MSIAFRCTLSRIAAPPVRMCFPATGATRFRDRSLKSRIGPNSGRPLICSATRATSTPTARKRPKLPYCASSQSAGRNVPPRSRTSEGTKSRIVARSAVRFRSGRFGSTKPAPASRKQAVARLQARRRWWADSCGRSGFFGQALIFPRPLTGTLPRGGSCSRTRYPQRGGERRTLQCQSGIRSSRSWLHSSGRRRMVCAMAFPRIARRIVVILVSRLAIGSWIVQVGMPEVLLSLPDSELAAHPDRLPAWHPARTPCPHLNHVRRRADGHQNANSGTVALLPGAVHDCIGANDFARSIPAA